MTKLKWIHSNKMFSNNSKLSHIKQLLRAFYQKQCMNSISSNYRLTLCRMNYLIKALSEQPLFRRCFSGKTRVCGRISSLWAEPLSLLVILTSQEPSWRQGSIMRLPLHSYRYLEWNTKYLLILQVVYTKVVTWSNSKVKKNLNKL